MTEKATVQKIAHLITKVPSAIPTNRPDQGEKVGNNSMPKYQTPPPPPPPKKDK